MCAVVEEGAVVEAWDVEDGSHTALEHAEGIIHPVGDGARRVFTVADFLQAVGELCPISTGLLGNFVADAPHDDRGAVAVLVDEVREVTLMPLVEVQVVAVGHLGLRPRVEALCHQWHPHLIAETYELGRRHVVRSADGIHAHILHQANLSAHRRFVDGSTQRTEVVMEASPLELQLAPIEEEAFASPELDGAYPEGRGISVEHLTSCGEGDGVLI